MQSNKQSIVPEVIAGVCVYSKGPWAISGRTWDIYNLIFADGRQTSVMVKPGGDLEAKVRETKLRFDA